MTGKTHFVMSTSVTILAMHPPDWKSFLICFGTAAIGSRLSDIDVSSSSSHKSLRRIVPLMIAVALGIVILDLFFHTGIWAQMQQNNGLIQFLVGFVLFICICIFGERQPHRTFMHSIAGVATIGFSVYIMLPKAMPYMVCSMAVHIILDLFNRKKIQLLYPYSGGQICFRLCSADGTVNRILFLVGSVLLSIEILLMLLASAKHLVGTILIV